LWHHIDDAESLFVEKRMGGTSHTGITYTAVGIYNERHHHATFYIGMLGSKGIAEILGKPLYELRHSAWELRQLLYDAELQGLVFLVNNNG
jgi:hypothetical protein